mmetsp:Transcript_19138/g.41285  ORF Transcript_19138/g.41285 Transcript_19138/m.41285 type:complete len:746 (-) Transcript_19138:1449-3686(-)|eukprot:CAMPEP_0202897132 /NCGR_PEP_ID=MMETSP1392-20130828/5972_1 /ASSEMBLY_ACC=CAM_ASM_000868 /TAXON_ID=225041 /ORGANISM="Chlamydomonas chlamydogama, Strain SAG 11-48b" /LENGTH=745 /DNA_ID=CAMNT_0049582697 /DNA_START=260 /DNA_END=2497 /DNA_ORIENTATION=+
MNSRLLGNIVLLICVSSWASAKAVGSRGQPVDVAQPTNSHGIRSEQASRKVTHPSVHVESFARTDDQQAVHEPGMATESDSLGHDAGPNTNRVPLMSIFIYTTVMALASGLGAVPFFVCGRLPAYWAGIANAVAVGVMFSASFDLLHEGAPHSATLTILGMLIGGLFIKASQDYLSQFEDVSFEDLQGADARKAMLIIGVMAAHAFGEGSGVGVSFSGQRGWAQGLLVTIAIGVHNVPEGMAVAGVMMSKGSSPTKALYWTLLCSFPQAIVAVPSYVFVETFSALLPLALGFAAGCMIWIAFAELIPDALESADHGHVATAATFSAAWLQCLSMFISTLEQPSGTLASPIQISAGMMAAQLLAFLPAILATCGAAALCTHLLPSVPLTLGASVGSLTVLSVGMLLTLILQHQQGVFVTLACAAAGAAVLVLLWATFGGQPSTEHSSRRGSEGGGGIEVKRSLEQQLVQAAQDSPWTGSGGVNGGHVEGLPAKHINGHHHINGEQHYLGQHNGHHAPHMNGASMPVGSMAAFGQPAAWHSNYQDPESAQDNGLPYWDDKQQQALGRISSTPGGAGSGSSGRTATFVAVILAAQGVPVGVSLVRAVAADQSVHMSHLWVPAIVAALPVGLACVGLGKAMSGAGWWPSLFISAGVAGMALMTAVCCLAGLPLGTSDVVKFDEDGSMRKVEAAIAGALLLATLRYLLPVALTLKARRTRTGIALGAAVAGAALLLQALLCLTTPYCSSL